MNIDPHTGKNYGEPPTSNDLRNFAAELDDRDEATQEELDMLRLTADRLDKMIRERDEIRKQRNGAMALVETIVHDVDVLSTRPAAAIKLNDLVAHINEWGDAARKILKESSETT